MTRVSCKYEVQFVGNDETGMNCVPATFTMMANALRPEEPMSLETAVMLSGGEEGKPIWPARSLIELDKRGFEAMFL